MTVQKREKLHMYLKIIKCWNGEKIKNHTCLRKTPQKVQLFFKPMALTISSIVQPYRSLYETIFNGSPYWKRKYGERLEDNKK